MKQTMETPTNPSLKQLDLGIKRTREELTRSILEKRKIGVPLDSEEQEEVIKEGQEDREEIKNSYPH